MKVIYRVRFLSFIAWIALCSPLFASDLTNLMPLEIDPAPTTTVTPTHTALLSGDWSNPAVWGVKDAGGLPGKGAIVHIPGLVHVTASGVLNDSTAPFFMVRVDGQLTLEAPDGVTTMMYVDTLFTNQMPHDEGRLTIEAQSETGTVDVVITPLDLRNPKNLVGWSADSEAYYTDGAPVIGWAETPVEDDGPGVLGRHGWDPAQLSLGIVAHGEVAIQGKPMGAHGEALAVIEDTFDRVTGIVGYTMTARDTTNWEIGQTVLVTSTRFTQTGADDFTRNATSNDTTATITNIVYLKNGTVKVYLDRVLDLGTYNSRTYSDGNTYFPSLGNLDRSVRIFSSAALNPDGSFSRPDSIHNPTLEETLGVNGSLTGENGHLITQRGHFMAMHTDDVDIRYASFNGMGRTDKSALIDDFAPAPLDADGNVFQANGQNSGLFVGKKAVFKRLFVDSNGNGVFEGRDVDPPKTRPFDSIVNQRGRYSVHLHRAGVDPRDDSQSKLDSAWIEGVVVVDAPGWAFVHHDSEAVLTNNISYNVVGVGFMSETGNENGVWHRNLSSTNTGFLRGKIDPPHAHEMNDVGRHGVAFWMEGRNLALFDNVASGSSDGFTWQPWGVDNIDTTLSGLSRINAILSHPDMTDIVVDAQIAIDPMVERLESISTDGIGAKNTNIPVRYFQGNRSLGNERGLAIQTGPGLADRKFNDAWSIFKDFTAFETQIGAFFIYTSKYLLEDFRIYGITEGTGLGSAFEFLSSTHGITLKDSWIELDNVTHGVVVRTTAGNPQKNLSRTKDLRGPGLLEPIASGWESLFQRFSDPGVQLHPLTGGFVDGAVYNPYHNYYDINLLRDPINDVNEEIIRFNLNSGVYLDFADDMIDLPGLIEEGLEHALPLRISTAVNMDLAQPVSISLTDDSATFGVVGLWRANQLAVGYTPEILPFVFLNDFIVRRLYFDNGVTIPGIRVFRALDSGRLNRTSRDYRQDIWSGALLEFDKTDALGSQRFAYSAGEAFDYGTHNERLVFSPAMINKTLAEQGYFTVDSMEFTNQRGEPEAMKFVQMPKLFTDRLTGNMHEKMFVVALDEAWGSDGSVDWNNVAMYAFDLFEDPTVDHVIAEGYGHFRDGIYQGQTLDFPQVRAVNGTDGSDNINFEYVDGEGDQITDGRDLVLAGLGVSDEIAGSLGADVIDGGEGSNDRVNYSQSTSAVQLNTATGVHSGGLAEGDALRNLEVFKLTHHNDTFIGSSKGEVVWPYDGYDRIETRGGEDCVWISESSGVFGDYIDLGDGFDTVSMKGAIPYTLVLTEDLKAEVNIVDAEQISGHSQDDVIDVIDTTTRGNGAQRNLELIRGHAGDDELRVTMVKVDLEGQSGSDAFHINHDGYNHFEGEMDITILDFNNIGVEEDPETLLWRGQLVDLANPGPDITVECNPEGSETLVTLGNDGTVRLQGDCFLPPRSR